MNTNSCPCGTSTESGAMLYHVSVDAVGDDGIVVALGSTVVSAKDQQGAHDLAKMQLWHHGLDITYHRPHFTTVLLGCNAQREAAREEYLAVCENFSVAPTPYEAWLTGWYMRRLNSEQVAVTPA
ncbi:hypothetical protein [Burkholderia sp. Ac-20365]|uniref:hypothetical protein n=1 Tax=Burkholderia sp. Ac-20365 TaxID=2703897 RepID=UPI00197B13F5|nr:hypothetical protein [Burkholderia sp. Ac-20365]MBN3761340.1 hypothetical protein [Burkholderia sp. Ac-20365]